MVVSVVTRGVSDDCNSFVVDGTSVWLRIARIGGAFAFHASTDGVGWSFVRYFALATAGEPSVGFAAQSRPAARVPSDSTRPLTARSASAICAAAPSPVGRRRPRRRLQCGGSTPGSQRRKPPTNALSVPPRRQPAGSPSSLFGLASAEHDIVRLHRGRELLDRLEDGCLPLLLAPLLPCASAHVVLEGALAEGEVAGASRGSTIPSTISAEPSPSRARGRACARLRNSRSPASRRRSPPSSACRMQPS